jgi:hypothetical protein
MINVVASDVMRARSHQLKKSLHHGNRKDKVSSPARKKLTR